MIILPSRYQNPSMRLADMTQDMLDLSSVVQQINSGASPDTVSNLDVFDSTVSQLIPSTPTVALFPSIINQQNVNYNAGTGVVTILAPGAYTIFVSVNCFNSVTTTLFYGAEANVGSGFTAVTLSGRQQNVNLNIQGQITFSVTSVFQANHQFRVYMWASNGTATFNTTTLTSLPGGALMVPAKRMSISASSSSG